MGFWSNLVDRLAAPAASPGDPEGVVVDITPQEYRALPVVMPSAWDGWPANWGVPHWDFQSRFNELIDIAWACLDLNASVLSTMPVYRTRNGEIVSPATWMANPDPTVYSSWHEFAKQLFWDYQLGEAFVLPVAFFTDGWPMTFRVVPPWLVHVEMRAGRRVYLLGPARVDVTADILHIRYKSTSDGAHGIGPLESAGARMLTAGVLAKYVREIAATGGVPQYTLETEQELSQEDADDLLNNWVTARATKLGAPPVLDNNVSLKTHQAMSPKQMAMLEISQFTEGRIAILLGVPPFLVGLPSGGDSMTYSNVSSLFDFHDRSSLRPKAAAVMAALSNWSLPADESAELNRDEYSRPAFNERADAWVKLIGAGAVTVDQFQSAERLTGGQAAAALTGANGDGGDREAEASATPREIAEMIQKIYLGVGVVISSDEARRILNKAGAGLTGTPELAPRGGGQ